MADYEYSKFSGVSSFYFHSDRQRGSNVMGKHHYHNLFELYYLIEGSCSYFIDNKSYEVNAGDLVLIPEGLIHRTVYDGGEHSRLLINFSRHFLPKSVIPLIPTLTYVYRNENASAELRSILEKIEKEYKTRDEYSDDILKSYTRLLFLTLARNENRADRHGSGSPFIESAVKYIQKNFANDISLSGVAEMHSVSPEHLSRRFKKETGFGFSEYVTLIRLQTAEYMLRDSSDVSVSEVAYHCGFNDSNYFSDRFKREYGMSPLKFRSASKETSQA